ncbi:hypothetical protein [Mycobacterium decipiens]|uniref:hypothetical protein n=1 Tax=Mycobacterium decipiens TaxID=1430326 RepID=UPI0013FD7B06|nr:hypothetical protein [Mycobacterium decipiens]
MADSYVQHVTSINDLPAPTGAEGGNVESGTLALRVRRTRLRHSMTMCRMRG